MKRVFGWLFMAMPLAAFCQAPGMELYQYNYTSINPAFAGIDGAKATAIGQVFNFEGGYHYQDDYKTYSSFVGFETPLKKINCGTGLTATVYDFDFDKGVIVNLPFNYQIKFKDKSKLAFGVRLGYQHMTFPAINYGPRPLDSRADARLFFRQGWGPFGGPETESRAGFTGSIGVAYRGPMFYAGFSVDNVVTSDQLNVFDDDGYDQDYELVVRQYNTFIGITLPWNKKISSDHSLYVLSYDDRDPIVDVNNSFVFFKTAIVGVTMGSLDDKLVPKVSAGVQLKNFGKLVVMVYSKTRDFPGKQLGAQFFLQVNINKLNEAS